MFKHDPDFSSFMGCAFELLAFLCKSVNYSFDDFHILRFCIDSCAKEEL